MAEEAQYPIVKTDTLKVEIFQLSMIDLSYRFMFRIVEPVPLMWQYERIAHSTLVTTPDMVAQFCLKEWNKMIENTRQLDQWTDELDWLTKIEHVDLIHCELSPQKALTFKNLIKKQGLK